MVGVAFSLLSRLSCMDSLLLSSSVAERIRVRAYFLPVRRLRDMDLRDLSSCSLRRWLACDKEGGCVCVCECECECVWLRSLLWVSG